MKENKTMDEIHRGLLKKFHTLCSLLGMTDDEKRALLVGVAYFRMIMFPDLQKAMKQSLSAVLYTEFNKKEV